MTDKIRIAKRFLSQAYWMDVRIDGRFRQVQSLRAIATRMTGSYEGDIVVHTRNAHSMEDAIVKVIMLEKELDAEIDKLVDTRRIIKEVIDCVADEEQRILLELRYESSCSWKEIETMIRVGHSQMFERHNRALDAVYDILVEKGLVSIYGEE